jgi:hypothetical protein
MAACLRVRHTPPRSATPTRGSLPTVRHARRSRVRGAGRRQSAPLMWVDASATGKGLLYELQRATTRTSGLV